MFSGDRLHGEWFSPSARLTQFIGDIVSSGELPDIGVPIRKEIAVIKAAPKKPEVDQNLIFKRKLLEIDGRALKLGLTLSQLAQSAGVSSTTMARLRKEPGSVRPRVYSKLETKLSDLENGA